MPADADDFVADILAVTPPLFIDRNVAFTRNLAVVESPFSGGPVAFTSH
jgi:hypothetical protein